MSQKNYQKKKEPKKKIKGMGYAHNLIIRFSEGINIQA